MRSSSSSIVRSSPNHLRIRPLLPLQSKNRIPFNKPLHRAQFHGFNRLEECAKFGKHGPILGRNAVPRCMDEGSMDVSYSFLVDDLGSTNEEPPMISSSEGEDSDQDHEIFLTPISSHYETPTTHEQSITSEDALSVAALRFAMLSKGERRRKYKLRYGVFTSLGLGIFLALLLALVDWCAWRIIRLPLDRLYVTRPFLVSALLVAAAGYVLVPLLKIFNIVHKGAERKGIPTAGGLYLVPIGTVVAKLLAGSSRAEVSGAVAVTLAFAVLGLLDDTLCLITNSKTASSRKTKSILEVFIAVWFSSWLDTADITSPYSMKMLIPLPSPIGLLNIGKFYILLAMSSLLCMENATCLADQLDGMASGVAALSFVGLSIAVLPICPDLSVFGASMAGACVGFLVHNRYKASVLMGNTGSMALGGALAAMASCSGMFLPLFIACGVFMLELLYLIMQFSYFSVIKKRSRGEGRQLCSFQAERLHNRLEIWGLKEPYIVAGCYAVSSVLAILAGYVGLISA